MKHINPYTAKKFNNFYPLKGDRFIENDDYVVIRNPYIRLFKIIEIQSKSGTVTPVKIKEVDTIIQRANMKQKKMH